MIFDRISSPADYVLALVHIPKTAGTSLRRYLGSFFEPHQRLEFYHGDLDELLSGRHDEVRFAVGHHIRWGVQESFTQSVLFVTVVRDPVDRFLSLFKELKNNPLNRLHDLVAGLDANEFLDFLLTSELPAARAQLGNLQCRLISNAPDAALAASYIRDHYYLACAMDQVDDLAALIADAYGRPRQNLPRLNVRPDNADVANLSARTRERLLEADAEDLQIYLSVRQQFAEFLASRDRM